MPPRKKSISSKKRKARAIRTIAPNFLPQHPSRNKRTVLNWIVIASSAAILLIVGSIPLFTLAVDTLYTEKVLPGVVIGKNTAVSGLTRQEVETILNEYKEYIQEHGIVFETPTGTRKILASTLSLNPDISFDQLPSFLEIDKEHTFERAYAVGRTGSLARQLRNRIALFFEKIYIDPVFILDTAALQRTLEQEFSSFQREYRDAGFALNEKTNELEIIPEQNGYGVDSDSVINEVANQIRMLQYPRITLELTTLAARITENEALFVRDQAHDALQNPFVLTAGEKTFEVTKNDMLEWIDIEKKENALPRAIANIKKIEDYLMLSVAPTVSIPTKDAKYEMENGKVVAFQAPQDGKELDIKKIVQAIGTALFEQNASRVIEIAVIEKPASAPMIKGAGLAIKEIIGSAETNFAGSPPNRRHNIGVGVAKLNGTIIQPDESFSLISVLGEIDKSGGFKPELVIKGTKTTPEYGGGLCQVSTTLFRAVSHGGLPILERRNHSYRVGYYEPPVGFDATIYFPKPDLRFLNDTKNPVLIQARVEGTKVKMELWGVQDGRKVEVDTPTVFNIKKAGPVKIIETTDLPPGKKKCTEKAHNGADAVFERRVTYPGGEIKKDVFKSHYIVWPAVCLVGKDLEPELINAQDDQPLQELSPSAAPPIFSDNASSTE